MEFIFVAIVCALWHGYLDVILCKLSIGLLSSTFEPWTMSRDFGDCVHSLPWITANHVQCDWTIELDCGFRVCDDYHVALIHVGLIPIELLTNIHLSPLSISLSIKYNGHIQVAQ